MKICGYPGCIILINRNYKAGRCSYQDLEKAVRMHMVTLGVCEIRSLVKIELRQARDKAIKAGV